MVPELQVYNLFFSLERSKGSAKSSQTLVKKGGLNLMHFAPLTNNIGHSRHSVRVFSGRLCRLLIYCSNMLFCWHVNSNVLLN